MSNETQGCLRLHANREQIGACSRELLRVDEQIQRLASVLSLAGNEVRLKILYLLDVETELCPCDLSDILGMSVPAVSQHLRKLKDAQIVQTRKDGQTIFYSLRREQLDVLQPILRHISDHSTVDAV